MHSQAISWSFTEIAATHPCRASALEAAPSASAILRSVAEKMRQSANAGRLYVGMEQARLKPGDHRVVIQFQVGETLFDQFFNARTGYRAQFRRDWHIGVSYNRKLIERMRRSVASVLPSEVSTRCLTADFEDCGCFIVPRERIHNSLDPDLSKIWFCGRRMTHNGEVVQLPSGATGPRLRLDDATTWAALAREDADAWLELKGAFVGSDGPYQPKDPVTRAKNLQKSGEA